MIPFSPGSVLGDIAGVPVTQGADPAVLTARIDGPSATDAAARGLALLSREWTEVAGFSLGQPSLDEVPCPDRPQRRPAGEQRGAGMTAVIAPPALTVANHAAVRRPRVLRNTLTMAWRAMLHIRREPELATDAIFIPVLFTLFFTYLFGGALSGSPREYLRFLLPGTLVLTVLLITVTAGVSLNTDRARGTLDRFRSMPIWQPSVIVGGLIGDMARYVLATCLVLGMGLLMGYRPAGGAGGVALAVALILIFAFSVSWVWTAASQVGWVLLASAALTAVFGPLTMRLYRAGQGGS